MKLSDTHQPFLVTLKSFRVKPLSRNNQPGSRFCRSKGLLVDPPFEYTPKPALTKHTIRSEVSGCGFELAKAEAFYIGRLQNFTLSSRSLGHRWDPAARISWSVDVFPATARACPCNMEETEILWASNSTNQSPLLKPCKITGSIPYNLFICQVIID